MIGRRNRTPRAMHKCLAVAFSLAIGSGHAEAVDLGLGVEAGGNEAGASVGAAKGGVSVGLGVKSGHEANGGAGVSLGPGTGSVSGTVDPGGRLGGLGVDAGGQGATAGTSLGGENEGTRGGTQSSVGRPSVSAPDPVSKNVGSATASQSAVTGQPTTTLKAVSPVEGSSANLVLPRVLRPGRGSDQSRTAEVPAIVPGAPRAVVSVCRAAIELAAAPFSPLSVRVASAGAPRKLSGGKLSAPLYVRIRYTAPGGAETRQALIDCTLDGSGKIVALS